MSVKTILSSRWTYLVIRFAGFGLLIWYLWNRNDWRTSPFGILAFPTISFSIGWLFVALKLPVRFPKLNNYLLYPMVSDGYQASLSIDERARGQVRYLENLFPIGTILSLPAEDGLFCVPVLLAGITPVSALFAGIIFGFMHLARFSYLECLGKAIYYSLVCYLILPFGLLTVVLGHMLADVLGLAMLRVVKKKMS